MSNVADIQDIRQTGFFDFSVEESDPAVAGAINAELSRQQNQIELIASENIVSKAVLQAQRSVFTNKYAEGYPGRRYYQGCAPSDDVETLAIERAKQLFDCGFVRCTLWCNPAAAHAKDFFKCEPFLDISRADTAGRAEAALAEWCRKRLKSG